MEQNTVTDLMIHIWVRSSELDSDGSLQFKGELLYEQDRHSLLRTGVVGIFSAFDKEKRIDIGESVLFEGHSTRSGFFFRLKPDRLFDAPQPPFLLTNVRELRKIYGGGVSIRSIPPLDEHEGYGAEDLTFIAGCNDWFGVVEVSASAVNYVGFLTAFSTQGSCAVSDRDILYYVNVPGEVFGTISPEK
jgi:hypothetical protein